LWCGPLACTGSLVVWASGLHSACRCEEDAMPNDAKLGMLAGVCGVIVAAVMFAQPRPPPETPPGAKADSAQTVQPGAVANTPVAPEPASTPVVRTRKEVDGQPASRTNTPDEEP
jgi:hypothetical protein